MKQIIVILFIAISFLNSNAQKIVGGEYFLDTYIKQGSGTRFTFSTPSSDTAISFQVDVSSLKTGIHTLYARTLNDSNQWSHTSKRLFYIAEKDTLYNLSGYEYSIDNYLEQGQGIFVPTDTEIPFEIDCSDLEAGLHILFIRTKNSSGIWSQTSKRLFIIPNEYEIPNIVSLVYYYKNQQFVTDTFEYNDFTPSRSIEIDDAIFMANTAGLEYNKTYELYVRAICDNGDISTFYQTSFEYIGLTNSINNDLADGLAIYPNPSNGLFNLTIDSKKIGKYYIFDTNGKLIKTSTDLYNQIDLTNYPTGTYVIKVKLNDKLYSTKLIIK